MFLRTIILGAAAIAAGCAGITAKPVPDADADTTSGFRYYDTSPFLLMYTDGKGGLTSKLMYLPDTTKLRSIAPYNVLANNTTTLKFDHGRLLGAKAVVDEAAIPSAIVASLEKIAVAALKVAALNASPEQGIPAPYLFRIVKTSTGWDLKGGQPLDANGNAAACARFQAGNDTTKCGNVMPKASKADAGAARSGGAK